MTVEGMTGLGPQLERIEKRLELLEAHLRGDAAAAERERLRDLAEAWVDAGRISLSAYQHILVLLSDPAS